MSQAAIEVKKGLVSEIQTKLENSVSTIVVDYRGLTVEQVTDLRKQLREAGVELKVLKNGLVRRAATAANYEGLNEALTGPNAIAFSNDDVVAPAKIIYDFAKANEALEIKAGVIEGNVVGVEEINTIASLPSREGLLSMLVSVLQAPMRNFAMLTKAVAEQKEQEEA